MTEETKPAETDKQAPKQAPKAAEDPKAAAEALQSGPPRVLSGDGENPNTHILPHAPKKYAGKYRITHGSVRVGDLFYGPGSILQMSADDGKNFSDAGTAVRLDE